MSWAIKFRIWDKEENKWLEPIYDASNGNLLDASITLRGMVSIRTLEGSSIAGWIGGRYSIVQYIGLVDKNGVEIYEGDILTLHNYNYFIRYTEDLAAFKLVGPVNHDGGIYALISSRDTDFSKMEKIGTIYENPGLLLK